MTSKNYITTNEAIFEPLLRRLTVTRYDFPKEGKRKPLGFHIFPLLEEKKT